MLTIVITGCRGINGENQPEIPYENNLEPIVLFCPDEGCGKNLEFLLNSAKSSIECAFFDLDLKNIINTLADKSSEVEVKVVIDNINYENQLMGNVKTDNSSRLMHNKFCIIDDKVVWTGSFNPTENGDKKNNNNVIVLYSMLIAENFNDEFEELWNGEFSRGDKVDNPIISLNNKKIETYFCPEDNCEEQVRKQIRNAKKSIYFMTFSFTSEGIGDEILFTENIDIKGVFEARGAGKFSQFERLKGFGINVKKDKNKANMHHKVFIIDNETVITGSYNPTANGNKNNDENLMIIHDKKIAGKYLEEFNKVFYQ
jgi:phosphatidylserine/phosphatidylglycerophosphate/cardiolipin synthase-like enzyme